MCPALAGGFFTTEPPENSYVIETNRNLYGGVGQFYLKSKLIEKEIRFVVNRGREEGMGKLDEGSSKV